LEPNLYDTKAPICWDLIKDYFKQILGKIDLNERLVATFNNLKTAARSIRKFLQMIKVMD
jgi:hypothetical protein